MKTTVTKISDGLYQINEPTLYPDGVWGEYVDAYLIVGEKRAVLIDTLEQTPDLYAIVRSITDLPLDVLITHGHDDHVGRSAPDFYNAGCKIYMNLDDYDYLKRYVDYVDKTMLTDLREGMTFDLGGRTIETLACPGHTPGCLVFYDRANRLAFSGDTVGSGGFWMQLDIGLPLTRFLPNLDRFIEMIDASDDLLVYPGHRNQSPVQLTGQFYKDARHITAGIIDGSIVGTDGDVTYKDVTVHAKHVRYGMMGDYTYDPAKITE